MLRGAALPYFEARRLLETRILNLLPAAVYACDTQGKIRFYNRQAAALWGREPKLNDPAELYSGSFKLHHPDGSFMAHAQAYAAEVLRSGQPCHDREAVVERPDGSRVAVLASVDPLRDEGGNLVGALAVFQDITERKRAEDELRRQEQALHESHNLLHAVVEGISDSIFVRDAQGRYLMINSAAAAELGLPAQQILARSVDEILPPHVASEFRRNEEAVLRSGKHQTLEQEFQLDGRTRRKLVSKSPYRDRGGNVIGVIGIARDITERKRAEEALRRQEQALRESHNLLRAVIEGTSDAVYVVDLEDRYLMINSAGARMLGRPVQDVLGKSNLEFFPPETARRFHAENEQILRTGRPETLEEVGRLGGATRTFLSMKAPFRDPDGRVIGVIGISRDITELKQMEEQRRHAQKMEAIGELVNGIAHNFNNTLTGIMLFGGMLSERLPRNGFQRTYIDEVLNAARLSSDLVGQLLAFSRKDAPAGLALDDLNEVLADQAPMLEQVLPENIELTLVTGKDLAPVRINRARMQEAILNLVNNARDAMPKGGKLVIETAKVLLDQNSIRQFTGLKPGPHVILSVSDAGQGMTAATRAHLFEPFFTTKPPGEGTGLGLATVYGTVKQLGGHVSASSEEGMGTTFKIHLPVVTGKAKRTPSSKHRPRVSFRKPRAAVAVLLVEDERSIREPAGKHLTSLGYKVLLARDGEEALRAATDYGRRIDLILSDVVMPRMGGPDLVRRMKEMHPRAKVVFMSGYPSEALLNQLDLRRAHLLRKPFTLEGLEQRVRQVMGAHRRNH